MAVVDHMPDFRDDENNTLTFERWESHVIENYPNPDRVDCPGSDVLQRFVDRPGLVTLDELNDTHITRCRECTLELRQLREEREQLLSLRGKSSPVLWLQKWGPFVTAAAACLVIAAGIAVWKGRAPHPQPADSTVANVDVDLSGDGVLRGSQTPISDVKIALPRRVVNLHLKLPYYSPAGPYRITVQADRKGRALRDIEANATANGPQTEVRMMLDMRDIPAGNYLFGTKHDGEAIYYYPLSVN